MTWLTWLNAVIAVLAAAGLLATAYGWRHSLSPRAGLAERYFAAAKLAYAIAIGARVLFWDAFWGLWVWRDPEAAIAFSTSIRMTDINIVTGLVVLAGVYCSLMARLLLIPEDEREGWSWWSAWLHPSLRRRRLERRLK